jgi:hypothetical protein
MFPGCIQPVDPFPVPALPGHPLAAGFSTFFKLKKIIKFIIKIKKLKK